MMQVGAHLFVCGRAVDALVARNLGDDARRPGHELLDGLADALGQVHEATRLLGDRLLGDWGLHRDADLWLFGMLQIMLTLSREAGDDGSGMLLVTMSWNGKGGVE
jgi:hypothetical protein